MSNLRNFQNSFSSPLINFDHTVNFSDEPEACEEADGSSQKEEEKYHNEGVAEVQKCTRSILNLEFCCEIVTAVDEKVNSCEAAG